MRRSAYSEFPLFGNLTQRKASCPNTFGCNSYTTITISSYEYMKIIYMRTAGWRIIWKKIIALIDATFAVAKKSRKNSGLYEIRTLGPLRYRFSALATNWANKPTGSRSLNRSIGRTLHRYRKGQGYESRTSLNFFRISFRNCKSCVYNCDDLLSYNNRAFSNSLKFCL